MSALPGIASPTVPLDAILRLRQCLVTEAPAPEVASLLGALLLKGFAHVDRRDYDQLL